MDVRAYNRAAWDRQVARGNPWTVPVSPQAVADARRGQWEIVLTACKTVPRDWFPPLPGQNVLCLASGGGQQGPLLAAAGARVTVFDNSPRQLAQDRHVARRDGLTLKTVEGDMADLSVFPDHSFNLIVHPVSNIFVPDVRPVWREAFRVLRPGGVMMAGIVNPMVYLFDVVLAEEGVLQVKYPLPYDDLNSLTEEERARYLDEDAPVEFSHTLKDQIGGQLDAGFVITALYEDRYPAPDPLSEYTDTFIATRAVKPGT